jgi:hypothetical protein
MNNLQRYWEFFGIFAVIVLLFPVATLVSPKDALDNADAALACENLVLSNLSASAWYRNNVPANTIDNNLNTRWSQWGLGSWISYDLGQEKTVCHLDIAWFKGNQRSYNFVISTSKDGSTFTDIYAGKSSGKSASLEGYNIADTNARYVKISVNGNTANAWAEITEADVYGYVSDVVAPTVTITQPVAESSVYVGSLVVKGSAADNAGGTGIQSIEVRAGSGASVLAIPQASGDWSSWSATLDIASEGRHVIYAKAIDGANNANENSIEIIASVDSGLPNIQISAPANGSSINIGNGLLLVNGSAFDAESGIRAVELKLDDGPYSAALPIEDWSMWTAQLALDTNGTHTVSAKATDNSGNVANALVIFDASIDNTGLDAFGIKKIYPTKDGKEWYVAMDDPASDPNFRNLQNLQLVQQPDGSWQVTVQNGQVRMEAWSLENEKWLNVEITEYARIDQTSLSLLQMYTRGGHHTSSDPCLGSAYKARLYGDGRAGWVKEVTHPAYTSTTGWTQATDNRLEGRWVGFKAVVYNFVENGKTYVRMESYIDDDVTDASGNLVIRNNWKLASVVEDRGGWATTNGDFKSTCSPMSVDNTGQYRQRDEILSLPGGTGTQNIAAWRTDQTVWSFKYLGVREIQVP